MIPDADLGYVSDFLSRPAADALLRALRAMPEWRRERLRMFGREVDAPRLTAWYGDPGVAYSYSGTTHVARGWPPLLFPLRARLSRELGVAFNGVLANRYRDGRDSMGWHSDDERELGPRPVIASISLGAQRRFRMRHRTRKDLETLDLPLEHGSLLVMKGQTQRHWRHCLPKTARCSEERINLTFRCVRTR
jgi:alkylated DNA repair dioxygenase AlkB